MCFLLVWLVLGAQRLLAEPLEIFSYIYVEWHIWISMSRRSTLDRATINALTLTCTLEEPELSSRSVFFSFCSSCYYFNCELVIVGVLLSYYLNRSSVCVLLPLWCFCQPIKSVMIWKHKLSVCLNWGTHSGLCYNVGWDFSLNAVFLKSPQDGAVAPIKLPCLRPLQTNKQTGWCVLSNKTWPLSA